MPRRLIRRNLRSKKTSLVLCEPVTFNYEEDYVVLDVHDDMLRLIRNGAHEYRNAEGQAYVFGELLDLDAYDHAGYIDISQGQVSFMEENQVRQKYRRAKGCDYEEKCGRLKSNDKAYLEEVQKQYPEIIWIGSIDKPKTSIHLHFHVDDLRARVDSVLLDQEYFYTAKSESDPVEVVISDLNVKETDGDATQYSEIPGRKRDPVPSKSKDPRKREDSKMENLKTEDSKREDSKRENLKTEDPKREDSKKEDSKPVADAPKNS